MAWTERYCDLGLGEGAAAGDGLTEGTAWNLRGAIANAAAGHRVNIKGAFSSPTSAVTINNAGTATSPIWWRGYYSTIGDCDPGQANYGDPSKYASIAMNTTNVLTFGAAYSLFSNLYCSSNRTTSAPIQCAVANSTQYFQRCKFETTGESANANAMGIATSSCGPHFIECQFLCSQTVTKPTRVVLVANATSGGFYGCTFTGADRGIEYGTGTSSGHIVLAGCLLYNLTDYGVYDISTATTTSMTHVMIGNTFYNIGSDCIYWLNLPPVGIGGRIIANNIFAKAVNGLNQVSGGNCANIMRINNYGVELSNAMEVGFGDFPSFNNVDNIAGNASDVFESLTVGNAGFLKPKSGTGILNAGMVNSLMPGLAVQGYRDIGAIQRVRDYPTVGNVTADDTVDGAAGTYHEATAAEVQDGVQFGAGGTEYTGTLVAGGGGTALSRVRLGM